MQNRIIIQKHKSKLLNIKKMGERRELKQPICCSTPFGVLITTLLSYIFFLYNRNMLVSDLHATLIYFFCFCCVLCSFFLINSAQLELGAAHQRTTINVCRTQRVERCSTQRVGRVGVCFCFMYAAQTAIRSRMKDRTIWIKRKKIQQLDKS
jgi:hypothetical protein